MTLVLRIGINADQPLAVITARRATHTDVSAPDPDTVVGYSVEVHQRPAPDMPLGRVGATSVEHRYGDGALALARACVDAVVLDPHAEPEPHPDPDLAAYAAALGPCYICGDVTNHGGSAHGDVTGDGRTRESFRAELDRHLERTRTLDETEGLR